MLTICSSCGLLTSSIQHQSGCKAATTTQSTRRTVSMTESSSNTEISLFPSISNEHILFAGTLRNWGDPLLQGQAPIPVPLCPRCVTCKCESIRDVPNSNYHHHPFCPNFHQHERCKTRSRQRVVHKPKRRANSFDASLTSHNHTGLIKQKPERSPSPQLIKRKKSTSKIPVRISTTTTTSSSNVTTTTSEYSPVSSTHENRSINNKTKIPRPISNQNLSSQAILTQTNQHRSSNDEDSDDYDHDSLNGDAYQTPPPLLNNDSYAKDISPKKKKKNPMMMYCTTNHFDNTDDQILLKKKKKMLSSFKRHSPSESSPERRQQKFWHKEGRHSKSKATEATSSSPINDLSSTTSSTSSSISNQYSSSIQLRKQSRPYRLASPSQTNQIPILSDDSLSERSEQLSKKRRPRSAFTSYETAHRPSRFESSPPPPSVYLIELTNNNRPPNSFGLTKTITYVWRNNHPKKGEEDLNTYPRYSVEQVSPIIDQEKRLIPISSRHITLQRGQTDYWQNMKTSPDSILTSSCHNHIGSASNLLTPPLENKQNEIKRHANSTGHVISITTTKRRQPSLLNQTQNTQWNIEGDGKQLRYSNLKWYSADQLQKDERSMTKHRTKRKQQQQPISDSPTDTGSLSEQHHRSAPPMLQQKSNMDLTHEPQEAFENTSMNKQDDYILFHREINDTSSPIIPNEQEQQTHTSLCTKESEHYETIIDEYSSPSVQPKLNSYSSTDEDVDELNLDYSEDIDRSTTTTIQTYRDRLNARLNSEQSESHYSRPRIFSTEFSQVTLDSGVDIASDQKISQLKIDELYSEQTTNQNDLYPLSDDSLLDIESPQINDLLLKTSTTTINDQTISLTEDSEEGRTCLTSVTDYLTPQKAERGPSNISELYYSADSDFNTSITNPNNDQYSGYELENLSDDDNENEKIQNRDEDTTEISSESSPPLSPEFKFQLPTFGDWIDQIFTTFLAETNHRSPSTSHSSSMASIHASQNTIDTSSSQVLTVIENKKNPHQNLTIISNNPIVFDDNNQINSTHRRSQSWPNNEQQQQDEQHFKDMSSSSLNNENVDFNTYIIDTNYEEITSSNKQDQNKQIKSLLLSSIESDDEEVINKGTMQNNHLDHHHTTMTSNTDQFHSDDENFSSSISANNNHDEKVKEKEHNDVDEKHIEIGSDNDNKNDKPVIQEAIPDDSSSFSFYEEYHYREPQQQQHTDSHDSLLQPDHHIMDKPHTAASSTDDLSTTHHLSLSAFHSKDSALGSSDDNLNRVQTHKSIIIDDDDDDDHQHQQISSSPLKVQHDKTIDDNEIQDNANNNIDKNEMTCEHNNNDKYSQINNNKMVYIHNQRQLLSPSYVSQHAERTISSSSSEQLIPKEKQTGMYYPAFGSSAAIHLAEKYNCEWLQDVTSPTGSMRKPSIIEENDDSSDLRVFHQYQVLGDDDEFILSLQTLQPSSSCPNVNHLITREPLRERSYSLTTLDAYARLDITRDTLEQMWLSLLDLAFSDKDDVELGEYKLRHIMGLSSSYTNMNESLEKSRSHGDIFSSTNKNQKLSTKKSRSFDVTSLPKSTTATTTNDSANVGLLQGAAISEPFIDRIGPTSVHSDTEAHLLDIDNDSIQSIEQDNLIPEEQYSPINQITSPVIKEPLNYVFHYPHQLDFNDEYDLEPPDEIINYLPDTTLTSNQLFGDEDKQLCMSLGFDDDEATAALAAAVVQTRDIQAILADYRPHSLSTIPSSRESQYASSIDDSDDVIDINEAKRKSTISNQGDNYQSEHTEDENENDNGEIESNISSPQSRPLSPIHSHSQTSPEQNQQLQLSDFPDIDHDAWARSISEPIYPEDLSIQHNNEQNLFTFTDNLTTIIPIQSSEQSQTFTIDQIERIQPLKEAQQTHFIEQTTENNLIDFSSQEDFIETMTNPPENKSTNSTRTSISSIHDTHLDPNELAYRLARLDSLNISSPPKKTLADELAELGEKHGHFENDSLDHSPPIIQEEQNQSFMSTPRTYSVSRTPPPLEIDHLTSMAKDIRDINQEKSISSLCTIVEDIHAQTNNQSLTKIVDYHQSPRIANLQTMVTELHQTPISKSIPRPLRPTHLQLDNEQEEEGDVDEQILSPVLLNNISIPSNIISNLEQNLASYKAKSPSPPPPPAPAPAPSVPITRRISEPPIHSTRYNTQRIDKVSDLEIVKQGRNFKIGYTDRQGTDQRVILTKRIEAGPDIMARDPHVRLPYKGRKILKQVYSSVLHTNGYNTIQEDKKFEHLADDIEVPIIGTNPQHFDESDMISIDIDGPSTMLNSICESIVITQGSVYSNNALKSSTEKPLTQPISKSIFDNNLSPSSSSRLRHVVLDQHEEYLLDSSRTPTPSTKKDKIEVIDTWRDRTVIEGSSTTWRSPPLQTYKATKHIQPSNSVQHFDSTPAPNTVQTRIAPSHDVKYRTSEHIDIPSTFDWSKETIHTPTKPVKTTRDIALSPIVMENKHYQTTSTSPIKIQHKKVDRSCQYSPPVKHDLGLQCYFENFTSSTQVSSHDLPNFLITHDGTQTINQSNYSFDDSGNQTHMQTISPSLSATSVENQHITPGTDFIRKLNEQHTHPSTLTVTKYSDGNYYLPSNDNNQTTTNIRSTTSERSAELGTRQNTANFGLQVDIKGSSSDSEDVSEVAQRSLNRMKPSTNGDIYEHHSELVITAQNPPKRRQNSSTIERQSARSSAKQIEQQISQLRRERTHILNLLSLNWSRSNIWVELTEAKLNYIIGETDALLRSLSFDASPVDSERVKIKMHQYEEDMADLTRQRLAVYRERLEDSKKQLDLKIDELELKKSSIENNTAHYSTLEYIPRVNNTKRSKSFLSTSAENLSNMPIQDSISSHPDILDISFLTSTPSNQATGLPPRYPRSPRFPSQQQSSDTYRTVYRPTPRYPSTTTLSNENRYDYPRYRTTSYVTPTGNLSGMQGLTKSQQAILDETDRLVKDSQQFHSESATQFERARESLLSSETPIRLARANMAASRLSPDSNYLPNDVTLAELFKYEQSLAKETAKNTRTYSSISTSAES